MKNKVVIIVLAFILTCVVGYALFSDNISVNGTATADGEFSIKMDCTPGVTDELRNLAMINMESTQEHELIDKTGGYSNDTCIVNGKNATFNVDLLYPTAQRNFTVKVTNNGSIPAKVTNIERNVHAKDYRDGKLNDERDFNETEMDLFGFDLNLLGFEKNGKLVTSQEEMLEFMDEESGTFVLQPNTSIYVAIRNYWSEYMSNKGQTLEFTQSIKMEWGQQNS